MSWLFGYNSKPSGAVPADHEAAADAITSEKKTMEAYRFDSGALERAAQAAKQLERSKHSKEALELSKLQEMTRQQQHAADLKRYEAAAEQARVEQKRIDYEERRRTLQEETKQHQLRAQYQDQLAKRRHEEQVALQQRAHQENLRAQEDSVARQEAARRATAQHEAELREKSKLAAVRERARAQAAADRDNRDLALEQIRARAAERRVTVLESIRTAASVAGAGLDSLLADRDRALALVGGLSALALGVYSARGLVAVAVRYAEARIARPSLVTETSRFSLLESLRHPVDSLRRAAARLGRPSDALAGVVLNPRLETKLRDIAIATKNTRKNKGFYRNVLAYGPPGTGKTLFAKRLAMHSDMHYAILTGGDVAALGGAGVAAVHRVFDWAEASGRGVVVFIDEADAFLRKRASGELGEHLRAALNAFLYRTSAQSRRVMLVLATNTPQQLDAAVGDRADVLVEFPLPGAAERERLVRHYFELCVLRAAARRLLRVERFEYGALCEEVARVTRGMSGRQLAKLCVSWQAGAWAAADNTLTRAMCERLCREAVQDHRTRASWLSEEERRGVVAATGAQESNDIKKAEPIDCKS